MWKLERQLGKKWFVSTLSIRQGVSIEHELAFR
jgi:hypothetical protein